MERVICGPEPGLRKSYLALRPVVGMSVPEDPLPSPTRVNGYFRLPSETTGRSVKT